MQVSGPFTVNLGAETDIAPPNGGTRFTRVVLANNSPIACKVNSGGVDQWLQPNSADVYPCDGGNPAEVTAAFTTNANVTTGQVTASWYLDSDTIDGTYPMAIPSPVTNITGDVNATLTGPVSITGNVTIDAYSDQILFDQPFTYNPAAQPSFTIPAGILSIEVAFLPAGGMPADGLLTIYALSQIPSSAYNFSSYDQIYCQSLGSNDANHAYLDVLPGSTTTLVFNTPGGLAANPQGALLVIGHGSPAATIRPPDHYPGPFVSAHQSIASGGSAPLVAAPAWPWIIEVGTVGANGTSTGSIWVTTTAGGAVLCQGGANPDFKATPGLTLNDGLTVASSGTAGTGYCTYRYHLSLR